ncbi:DUF2321 domain-containing protein [Rhizobium sp. AG207R]|uniref:DUF2321 domain-containing protein n=1 Tax=Rhizobium sp. AG207R TaxID=2802287 RepID=UPI0022AC0421|nr:DUF2321 domain-containing protein [Rhizobium sp. AG207R]MCZ3380399.1 DUF2321 domain-containing protein [Rhizobium sp. AG207R]
MGYYQVGQVCLNGHEITSNFEGQQALRAAFCSECGEATIHKCQHCDANIRGWYHVDGFISMQEWVPPSYCHACGKPFPWIERAVAAARDLADEIENIEPAELERAKQSFLALTADTPQTAVAAARIKKLLSKAGPVVGKGIRDIVVSIATDAAKKTIGL